jgi:MFS family permease
VLWELRTRAPMLPMRLFRSHPFSAGNATIFFLWGSALGAVFFMAQFLQTGLGHGPLLAGLGLMPWGATTVIVPPIAGALISRLGERPFIVAGMSLHALGVGWIALIAEPDLAYWQLVAPLIVSGAGVAMAIPATQSSVLSSVSPSYLGKASGTFSTTRQLGGAFGVAVLVAVFAGPAATPPPRRSPTRSPPRSAAAPRSRWLVPALALHFPADAARPTPPLSPRLRIDREAPWAPAEDWRCSADHAPSL